MAHGIDKKSFEESFADNVAGKLSKSNQIKTNRYLKQLYNFDFTDDSFSAFYWFWKNAPESELPTITLLYAIKNDYLLAESVEIINSTPLDIKVPIETLEKNILSSYPERYSKSTLRSLAQNIASSWKQSGFILGRTKNIRVQPKVNYWTVTFALLLSYLEDRRGEFLLKSIYIKALGLPESNLRDLMVRASQAGLMQYQHSGHVTTIMFPQLLKKIGIYGQ
jgi:hypothetical protein